MLFPETGIHFGRVALSGDFLTRRSRGCRDACELTQGSARSENALHSRCPINSQQREPGHQQDPFDPQPDLPPTICRPWDPTAGVVLSFLHQDPEDLAKFNGSFCFVRPVDTICNHVLFLCQPRELQIDHSLPSRFAALTPPKSAISQPIHQVVFSPT
jgi:hypothetical protein